MADGGCLEGGYPVEFARMEFQVLGIEVRKSNVAACNYAQSKTDLPQLEFVRDNGWNIDRCGRFDAVFCCGLLNHLDHPKHFLEEVFAAMKKLLILQTHFALISDNDRRLRLPTRVRWFTDRILRKITPTKFVLSSPAENEGRPGRWYTEFVDQRLFRKRESANAWGDDLALFCILRSGKNKGMILEIR
ncbi:methyltransferase domain-containing protein [Mycobacterium sp.]|uniref:class I SAM-dependent methyltransferase n=1 Tax=Mycobacterium sp. TaxID=1785 RepID=UPI0025E36E69|nr:methyltransferase domain-containing protein [Mycobacterium sp.]